MLIDFTIDSSLSLLIEDTDLISRLVASRKRFESWLQIEVFKRFIRRFPGVEIAVERPYPNGGQERCDLWCMEADGSESWVELKTCATNYEQHYGRNSARPITNQINDITRDIDRLTSLPPDSKRHLFLLVYPMPASGIPPEQWLTHLKRIQGNGSRVTQVLTAPVGASSRKASVVGYTVSL